MVVCPCTFADHLHQRIDVLRLALVIDGDDLEDVTVDGRVLNHDRNGGTLRSDHQIVKKSDRRSQHYRRAFLWIILKNIGVLADDNLQSLHRRIGCHNLGLLGVGGHNFETHHGDFSSQRAIGEVIVPARHALFDTASEVDGRRGEHLRTPHRYPVEGIINSHQLALIIRNWIMLLLISCVLVKHVRSLVAHL